AVVPVTCTDWPPRPAREWPIFASHGPAVDTLRLLINPPPPPHLPMLTPADGICPVSHPASALDSTAPRSAIPPGKPSRRVGEPWSPICRYSSVRTPVSVMPGDTALTVIPRGASSWAMPLVNCSNARLLPRYALAP